MDVEHRSNTINTDGAMRSQDTQLHKKCLCAIRGMSGFNYITESEQVDNFKPDASS